MKKMKSYTKSSILRIAKFVHIIITIAMSAVCLYYYNTSYNHSAVGQRRFLLFLVLYAVALCFSLRTYRSYDLGFSKGYLLIFSQSLSDLIAGVISYVVFVIANSKVFTPLPLIILILAQFVFNCFWTFAARLLYISLNEPKKSVVFYSGKMALLRLHDVIENNRNFKVEKLIEIKEETFEDIIPDIKNSELIFTSGINAELRNEILSYCTQNSIHCYVVPLLGDILMRGGTHLDAFSVPLLDVCRAEIKIEYALAKRAIDIIISLIAIIVLSPLMLATALAITLYDKGPALYKQIRLTQNGKEFEIWKFRSMRVNAESDGVARLASANDDRITPVGKIIRACRLDELPQLFNILRGEMTIVGPRPERPEIAAQYEEELPEFKLRLQVKAGLTGLAQIYGRYNSDPYEKLQMDLMYINRMSFTQDLMLMFATVKILFMKESTQGTAEGQLTALSKSEETENIN